MKIILFFLKWYILPAGFLFFFFNASATIRYVKPVASGLANGSSWINASADLQLMINNSSSGDEIWVAAGTYYPTRLANNTASISIGNRDDAFVLKSGVKIYGGFAGTETLLASRNWATHTTILSADIGTAGVTTDNCYHVVISSGPVGTATLDGFSIQAANGNVATNLTVNANTITRSSGSISIATSSPTIANCVISNNMATNGAAIYITSSLGISSPVFNSCLISGNMASGIGAAIYINVSAINMNDCSIAANRAASNGGGIYFTGSSLGVSELDNCIIYGNKINAVSNNISINGGAFQPIISYCIVEGGISGTGNVNADPLFLNPLAASAAPASGGNYRVQKCSPAFNAGNNSLVPVTITNDLDNNTRIIDTIVDIGAYERQDWVFPDASGILYVDHTKNGDGSSWANALSELADAMLMAGYNSSVQQIWVAKGTYYPKYNNADSGANLICTNTNRNNTFLLVKDVKLYGGFAGGEISLSQRDWVINKTILSGDIGTANDTTDNCYHVVLSAGNIGTAVFDGFTITLGYATGSGHIIKKELNNTDLSTGVGAGMKINESSPQISNCTFIGNRAASGGGMHIHYSHPLIENCRFEQNIAEGGFFYEGISSGAGVLIEESFLPITTINNSIFLKNKASGGIISSCGGGGGIVDAMAYFTGCLFTENKADSGGAVGYKTISAPVPYTLKNCSLIGNTAAFQGGAIYNDRGSLTSVNCLIAGNISSTGGGITNVAANIILSNVTLVNNKATSSNGGLLGTASNFKNSIIWGNSAPAIPNLPTPTITVTYSDVEGGFSGAGNINSDPLFISPVSASSAPTTTGNYRLQRCSPAINTGNNALIPSGVTTDLDSNARINMVTVDMGTYEKHLAIPDANGIVYVDATKSGDGSSWVNAVAELADALYEANLNTAINQIWVAKGTYYPKYNISDAASFTCSSVSRDRSFLLVNNVKLYGGFAGGETLLSQRDWVNNITTLSGDVNVINDSTDNCYHVLLAAGPVGTAEVDGFTITKGNANGNVLITVNGFVNAISEGSGGGLFNYASSPAINNCIFSRNASIGSAAIAELSSSSSAITNCTFSANVNEPGGSIVTLLSTSNISNSSFLANTGTSLNIYGSSMISNCNFFSNNGNCINNSFSSVPTINYCSFSGNTGSCIYNTSTSAAINNCLFTGNKGFNGVGIYNTTSSSVSINNCTFAANWATNYGPAVYNYSATSVNINNSIIYGNWGGTTITEMFTASGNTPILHNSIVGFFPGSYSGVNNYTIDPIFISSQPYTSAPTTVGNYRLQSCSPAINMGNNSYVPGSIGTDLDGNTRIKFTDVDLGAYEVQTQDATQSTWRGINTNWNDKINWCGGYIPTASTDVTIPTGLANYPVTAAVNAVKNISLANSTAVTVNSPGSLTINGTYSNSGCNISNNGTWVMAGTAAGQSFPGTSATVSAMNNLEINNTSGIAFDKSFSITGTLTPTAGNINVNNNIAVTLKSTATATAAVSVIQPAASISYTGTGAFIVERFINTGTSAGQHAKSWQFLATPVTGQTIFQSWQESGTVPAGYGTWITGTGTGFDATTTLPSLKFYNQAAGNWTAITNTGSALINKLGYMLFVRGDRTVTTSNGTPNNTTLRSKGLLFSPTNPAPSVAVPANTFQTFGNPYASRIEFNKVRLASTGINDVFYVWDPTLPGTYNLGGYQTITGIAGYVPTVGTPPTGNAATDYYPAGVAVPYIESGQAVFVKGNGTGGNVNFNENVKATGSRLVNRLVNTNSTIARRQLLFTTLFTNTGKIADGNIISFERGFGNEVNEYDAEKIMNGGENFGLIRDGKMLAVEAHEPAKAGDTIFYHMSNLRQQAYQLRFAPVNMAAINRQPVLIDRFTNAITPLSLTDSSFADFVVSSNAASAAAGRFIIVFKGKNKLTVTQTDIKAYRREKHITVEWDVINESNNRDHEVEKSLDGKMFNTIATLPSKNNGRLAPEKYIQQDTNPNEGVNYYRIKSNDQEGSFNYSKVIKVVFEDAKHGISVYPNPVEDGKIQLWFKAMEPGLYTVRVFNTEGQLLLNKQIQQQDGNTMQTINVSQLLAHGNYQLEITGPGGFMNNQTIKN